MNKEEICDNLGYWVKLNKPITRKQAEDTLDFILEQGNEIERLNKEIEKYKFRPCSEINFKNLMKARSENIKLHSIIKEVREYVENKLYYDIKTCKKELLEILDKGSDKE